MRNLILVLMSVALTVCMAVDGLAAGHSGPRPKGSPPANGSRHSPYHPPGRFGGDGQRPFGVRRGPPIFQELTDEQVAEVLAFVREKMPWRYEDLKRLSKSQPEAFRHTCRRLRFEIAQLNRLKKTDHEAYEAALEERRLKERATELAKSVREAKTEEQRRQRTDDLHDVARRLFDAEMKAREAQMRELEKRMGQFRRNLRERAEQRDAIVAQLVKNLIEGRRGNDRKPPPAPGPGSAP